VQSFFLKVWIFCQSFEESVEGITQMLKSILLSTRFDLQNRVEEVLNQGYLAAIILALAAIVMMAFRPTFVKPGGRSRTERSDRIHSIVPHASGSTTRII
jgi:hypothetical protein